MSNTLTAMQELIDGIDEILETFKDANQEDRFFQGMFSHLKSQKHRAQELLHKEKEQISNAYGIGFDDGSAKFDTDWFATGGDDYYHKQFKTKNR